MMFFELFGVGRMFESVCLFVCLFVVRYPRRPPVSEAGDIVVSSSEHKSRPSVCIGMCVCNNFTGPYVLNEQVDKDAIQ